jgi:hypothetical protein
MFSSIGFRSGELRVSSKLNKIKLQMPSTVNTVHVVFGIMGGHDLFFNVGHTI